MTHSMNGGKLSALLVLLLKSGIPRQASYISHRNDNIWKSIIMVVKKKEFYAIRGIDLIFKILKLKNGLIYTIKKC